jgi:hemerythrin-like domain-containing protein
MEVNGAKVLINSFKKFESVFFMMVYKEIFNITDTLYSVLQLKNLDVAYYIEQFNSAINKIKSLRNDDQSTYFYNEAKKYNFLMRYNEPV